MLFWSNGSLTFNIIFCQRYYSLRSWRYCLDARLKFWRRSHNPKKEVGDEAFEMPISPGLRRSWRLRHQISLDYYTIQPATRANFKITMWLPHYGLFLFQWWHQTLNFCRHHYHHYHYNKNQTVLLFLKTFKFHIQHFTHMIWLHFLFSFVVTFFNTLHSQFGQDRI